MLPETVSSEATMRFDAVLFDNGGTLTHRTSPVAAVRALAARLGVAISEEEAARHWRRSKEHSRTLMKEKRQQRNLSRADHREAYVAGYAPFEEIAPGLAELMYDEWKTNPLTMVPYPDTPAVLKSFAAGRPADRRSSATPAGASTRATRRPASTPSSRRSCCPATWASPSRTRRRS